MCQKEVISLLNTYMVELCSLTQRARNPHFFLKLLKPFISILKLFISILKHSHTFHFEGGHCAVWGVFQPSLDVLASWAFFKFLLFLRPGQANILHIYHFMCFDKHWIYSGCTFLTPLVLTSLGSHAHNMGTVWDGQGGVKIFSCDSFVWTELGIHSLNVSINTVGSAGIHQPPKGRSQ